MNNTDPTIPSPVAAVPMHDRHVWPHKEGPVKPPRNYAALKAVATLGVFVLGCVIGASGASGSSKTETTIVTPASCKTALDNADKIMSASADAFGAVSKAFDFASRFDAAGMQSQIAPEKAANDKVSVLVPAYTQASTDCRSK